MVATFYHILEVGFLKVCLVGYTQRFVMFVQRMSISITDIVYIRIYYPWFVTWVFWKCISGFHILPCAIWSLMNS